MATTATTTTTVLSPHQEAGCPPPPQPPSKPSAASEDITKLAPPDLPPDYDSPPVSCQLPGYVTTSVVNQPPVHVTTSISNLPPVYPVTSVSNAPAAPVVVGQPRVILATPSFRDVPVRCVCANCNATISTTLTYEVGSFTILFCLLLIFMGFWMGCCVFPFFVDSFKDVNHSCPNCNSQLGTYRRL